MLFVSDLQGNDICEDLLEDITAHLPDSIRLHDGEGDKEDEKEELEEIVEDGAKEVDVENKDEKPSEEQTRYA